MLHTFKNYNLVFKIVDYYCKNKVIFDKVTKPTTQLPVMSESDQSQTMSDIEYAPIYDESDDDYADE